MHYLVHGANAIGESIKYIEGGISYDPKSIKFFLSTACDALSLLYEDDIFAEKIHDITHNKNLEEVAKHFNKFSDEFLALDKALLISSGMNPRVANYLFRDFEKSQEIITNPEGINYRTFKNAVYDLKDLACENIEENKKTILSRALNTIGGAAVITVNHLADIYAPMLAESSKVIGGSMVGKGLFG